MTTQPTPEGYVLVPRRQAAELDDGRFLFAFVAGLHREVPEDAGPVGWSDFSDEQRTRLERAWAEMVREADAAMLAARPAAPTPPIQAQVKKGHNLEHPPGAQDGPASSAPTPPGREGERVTDAPPSPFSKDLPTFQIAWDSTSLGWLKRCPRLYQYFMIEGWSPRSKGIHLVFGSLYAAALERYAHAHASGMDHLRSQRMMVRWVLENSGSRPHEVVETSADGEVVQRFCPRCGQANDDLAERCPKGEFIPWSPGDHPDANIKNRYTLLRSLVWNTEERAESPYRTVILANGRPAVELSFNFQVATLAGDPISLAGHMDELVEDTYSPGAEYCRDDKTTKSPIDAYFAKSWTPNNQMSLYTLAGKVIRDKPIKGVLVKGAQIGVNFTRFRTIQVPRPVSVVNEWLDDTLRWIKTARHYAEEDHWPMNDSACTMYGGCPFQKVCSVSPSHRKAWLTEDFEKREWNPLAARGDI